MVITDMRMESDQSGREVIAAARLASYHPAIAMLSAFPVSDEDWQTMGADKMLVKPMHTRILLEQIEKLLASHEAKLSIWSTPSPKPPAAPAPAAKKIAARRPAAKRLAGKGSKPNPKTGKSSARKPAAKRATKASKR
jgi:DNA-binding response OmpR family regulator